MLQYFFQPTTCPVINILPPISQCQGRPSNCWSVGVADTDCIGNALCCFDGCANVCRGEGLSFHSLFAPLHHHSILGPINGNPGPQSNARGQQRQKTANRPNNNLNSNKPQVFQQLTEPVIEQELGASSPAFQTITQSNPTGYGGQPLPTQNQPLVQSIQKQQPINIITKQQPIKPLQSQPLITTIQKQPTINTVENEYDESNSQYVLENGNAEYYPTSLPTSQEQPRAPVYPDSQGFVFPQDDEETSYPTYPQTSYPTFPQTSNPSFSNISPANLQSGSFKLELN